MTLFSALPAWPKLNKQQCWASTHLMYFNVAFAEWPPRLLDALPERAAAGAGGHDFLPIAAPRRSARPLLQDVAL